MNAPSRLNSGINITPLVDVMLVLLIIFMVVTPIIGEGVDVKLPKAPHPSVLACDKCDAQFVSLHFAGDRERGELWIGQNPAPAGASLDAAFAGIARTHPGARLTLRADARLEFAAIRPVMKAAQNAGFTDIQLAATPTSGGTP